MKIAFLQLLLWPAVRAEDGLEAVQVVLLRGREGEGEFPENPALLCNNQVVPKLKAFLSLLWPQEQLVAHPSALRPACEVAPSLRPPQSQTQSASQRNFPSVPESSESN